MSTIRNPYPRRTSRAGQISRSRVNRQSPADSTKWAKLRGEHQPIVGASLALLEAQLEQIQP